MTREQLRRHVTWTAFWLGVWNAWVSLQAVCLVAWLTGHPRTSAGLWWALTPTWGPLGLAVGIAGLLALCFFLVALVVWLWRRRRGPPVQVVETDDPPPPGTTTN